jgi:hypothetical protein
MTVADLIESLPMSYEECETLAVVFPQKQCQALVNAQAWYGNPRFQAAPLPLTDGRWMLHGGLLSEVPVGLYGAAFQRLNHANLALCDVMPLEEALSLRYSDEEPQPSLPLPEPEPVDPQEMMASAEVVPMSEVAGLVPPPETAE